MILEIKTSDYEIKYLAERVFFKSIDLVGGLDKLAEYRNLTWLPSLARASFVIVLREEYLKTEDEIAKFVGISRNTVRQILRADPNLALYKIEHIDELNEEEKKQLKVHTAGGIAKLAHKLVKDGEDSQTVMEYCRNMAEKITMECDAPWSYIVLKNIKGVHYPITSPDTLIERLKHISIKGISGEEIVKNINYPIKNPAELLKEIKDYIASKGL
ncbi:bacterio-opsin activator [Caminibacter mediatlanticus TB-2]|uniref:Bacterio-opsin activator n=1 Tax=Caminibacter mediatlanticus TB-2 TaxID=391592 RepID=A0ABX5V7Q2_9BACT|nr:bacterio-opsin activator [Caminibacter mediatlanticus]QCT94261.1 bacterio-opsin activator [Caminibacter mediatlanticus TB-2]